MRQSQFLSLLIAALLGAPAGAAPVVDGTRAGDAYGPARAVQTIQTGFGNNLGEWNAAYGVIDSGRLYLMFTGNHESNFNKVEIWIDSVAGGSNVLPATPGNDGAGVMGGMTLDSGFEPEYHLIARRGFDGGLGQNKYDLDIAELGTANFDSYVQVFGDAQTGAGSTGTGTVNASAIEVGYDDSNNAGIGDSAGDPADTAAALAVETGLELSIDLADIGSPAGPVKVMLLQNNDNHDFLSNQTLGGLPVGTQNLGSPAADVDFSQIPGNQFFVVPEPAMTALAGVGALLVLRRRRSS